MRVAWIDASGDANDVSIKCSDECSEECAGECSEESSEEATSVGTDVSVLVAVSTNVSSANMLIGRSAESTLESSESLSPHVSSEPPFGLVAQWSLMLRYEAASVPAAKLVMRIRVDLDLQLGTAIASTQSHLAGAL